MGVTSVNTMDLLKTGVNYANKVLWNWLKNLFWLLLLFNHRDRGLIRIVGYKLDRFDNEQIKSIFWI
jgi:hypothetical protein